MSGSGHATGSQVDFAVRGWCPGALRPMQSGDGLVVRVRPRLGRFSQTQVQAIAAAALRHGSGVIDLTSRANLQMRGVRSEAHADLIADLDAAGLVDATEADEARRNILVGPFADATEDDIARLVEAVLPGLPPLPGKFGFAVDCGTARVLARASADLRVERDAEGALMLRADGMERGWRVDATSLAGMIARLVAAYVRAGGGRGRMAEHIHAEGFAADLGAPKAMPAMALVPPVPMLTAAGALVGLAFGQTDAATLAALGQLGPLRLTPWRMVLVEGARAMPDLPGLITHFADPLTAVVACTGAPGCPQGLAPTRPLARALAPHIPEGRVLHVSGCAKGCAHPGAADVTLVAAAGGFELIRRGTARDASLLPALSAQALFANPSLIKDCF